MVRLMQNGLPADDPGKHKSLVEQYMGGRMSVTLQCTESETEPPVVTEENFLHLSCFIGQETGHMNSGLKAVSTSNSMSFSAMSIILNSVLLSKK
jgi:hypothetical protein